MSLPNGTWPPWETSSATCITPGPFKGSPSWIMEWLYSVWTMTPVPHLTPSELIGDFAPYLVLCILLCWTGWPALSIYSGSLTVGSSPVRFFHPDEPTATTWVAVSAVPAFLVSSFSTRRRFAVRRSAQGTHTVRSQTRQADVRRAVALQPATSFW